MQFPGPVRAVVGLLANAADEAKHLPDRAIELPMLAVSTALQLSLRAQQRYARLAARGDDVLHRRPAGDEPPEWATFDDPVPLGDLSGGPQRDRAGVRDRAASELLDSLFGPAGDEPSSNGAAAPTAPSAPTAPAEPVATAPAAVKKAAVKKAAVKTAPVKKTAARTVAKKAPAKKAAAPAKATAKAPAAEKAPTAPKNVSKPRHTTPSRFDDVDDE
jgi:hypothetical protein